MKKPCEEGFIYVIIRMLPGVQTKVIYVGQTDDLEKRWKAHKRLARIGSQKPLYKTIRALSPDKIDIVPLMKLPASYLNIAEYAYIAHYNTLFPHGCNLTTGVSGREVEHDDTYYFLMDMMRMLKDEPNVRKAIIDKYLAKKNIKEELYGYQHQ